MERRGERMKMTVSISRGKAPVDLVLFDARCEVDR